MGGEGRMRLQYHLLAAVCAATTSSWVAAPAPPTHGYSRGHTYSSASISAIFSVPVAGDSDDNDDQLDNDAEHFYSREDTLPTGSSATAFDSAAYDTALTADRRLVKENTIRSLSKKRIHAGARTAAAAAFTDAAPPPRDSSRMRAFLATRDASDIERFIDDPESIPDLPADIAEEMLHHPLVDYLIHGGGMQTLSETDPVVKRIVAEFPDLSAAMQRPETMMRSIRKYVYSD